MFVTQIAQMPRPQESLRKNEKRGANDGEADGRRRMSQVVASAKKEHQNYVAHPT